MKKLFLLSALLFVSLTTYATDPAPKYNIVLTGASFASSDNGWFELGCRAIGANPINLAISGESIANTANRMASGQFYSPEQLETMDALVIMQVHNRDVADESDLKASYTDYTMPMNYYTYAPAYDYVIKRYQTECYNLKDNPTSKYYGTKGGKPAVIVLCTDWHDARTTYNTSIRVLSQKWGFPLVEFDRYIGFSRNTPNPVTGEQQSLLFSLDSQTIDEVVYGWHPQHGQDKYIQQRMGAIFATLMKQVLPLK
jgi:hypothetical protein